MVEEALGRLEVVVKGSGSLISHPPVFSPDAKTVYLIQNNTLFLYDSDSGRCFDKFVSPSASPIAGVAHPPEDEKGALLVFTAGGRLLRLALPSMTIISSRTVEWRSSTHPPVNTFTGFRWAESHFFLLGYTQESTLPSLYSVKVPSGGPLLYRHEAACLLPNSPNCMDVGVGGRFVVAIGAEDMFVKDMVSNVCRRHMSGTRRLTCVAVHPFDWICATGDDTGRIVVWSNVFEAAALVGKSIYHWHTLPLSGICFSSSGSQLYSGGGECTLVKWDLNTSGSKKTLPRLGLPIRHVSTTVSNELIAVSQADNVIKLINAYNEVVLQIQNLTQCYIPDSGENSAQDFEKPLVFRAGLHVDPNNNSLVMNARPGHLQCYSFREDRHLYGLDITQQNFVTAERNNAIPNADVSHVHFSRNGTWMSTVEDRKSGSVTGYTELRLKFWKFQREKQLFVLNTSIDWPHEGGVHSLKLQPVSPDSVSTLIAATTGFDHKFKIWGIIRDLSIHGKSEWWNCEFIGSYHDRKCGPLSFSEDGSLLAVGFEKTLTVWTTHSYEVKLALSHSKLPEDVKLVEFGTHQSAHLLVAGHQKHIAVWDIITSSLLWVAPFQADCLVMDPFSNLAAAVSDKQHLIFFSPDNPSPLAVHKNISSSKIISATFVSNEQRNKLRSTLFLINSSQELSALLLPIEDLEEDETDTAAAVMKALKIQPNDTVLTPFARLLAPKTIYESVKKVHTTSSNQVGLEGYKVLREIMDQSPHTMPSLRYYCTRLLQALNKRRNPGDYLAEIEAFAKKTQTQSPNNTTDFSDSLQRIKLHTSDSDNEDEEEEDVIVDNVNVDDKPSMLHKKNFNNAPSILDIDLDAVVSEDTSWIDCVFN